MVEMSCMLDQLLAEEYVAHNVMKTITVFLSNGMVNLIHMEHLVPIIANYPHLAPMSSLLPQTQETLRICMLKVIMLNYHNFILKHVLLGLSVSISFIIIL